MESEVWTFIVPFTLSALLLLAVRLRALSERRAAARALAAARAEAEEKARAAEEKARADAERRRRCEEEAARRKQARAEKQAAAHALKASRAAELAALAERRLAAEKALADCRARTPENHSSAVSAPAERRYTLYYERFAWADVKRALLDGKTGFILWFTPRVARHFDKDGAPCGAEVLQAPADAIDAVPLVDAVRAVSLDRFAALYA